MESKENIVKWIAQRISDEHRKHSTHNQEWANIAALKIYNTYNIKLKFADEQIKLNEDILSANKYNQYQNSSFWIKQLPKTHGKAFIYDLSTNQMLLGNAQNPTTQITRLNKALYIDEIETMYNLLAKEY